MYINNNNSFARLDISSKSFGEEIYEALGDFYSDSKEDGAVDVDKFIQLLKLIETKTFIMPIIEGKGLAGVKILKGKKKSDAWDEDQFLESIKTARKLKHKYFHTLDKKAQDTITPIFANFELFLRALNQNSMRI